jgi:hypothetical protein
MDRFHNATKWVMLVSGLITCSMIFAAIDPAGAMKQAFGESVDGALAEMLVRNWGKGVFLFGVMLIWGAFSMQVRTMALVIVGLSKAAFIALVVAYGEPYLSAAKMPVVIDSAMVGYFAVYIIATRGK